MAMYTLAVGSMSTGQQPNLVSRQPSRGMREEEVLCKWLLDR